MYQDWFPITGGSTVMLRTLPALKMLGFRNLDIYGFDSCWKGSEENNGEDLIHHAFEQSENDVLVDRVVRATVEGRDFYVDAWMLTQAHEFIIINNRILGGMNIKIHGDGLIAWCIETGIDQIDGLKE